MKTTVTNGYKLLLCCEYLCAGGTQKFSLNHATDFAVNITHPVGVLGRRLSTQRLFERYIIGWVLETQLNHEVIPKWTPLLTLSSPFR